MAFDGVLAFQGKDHITASQLGRIVEGVAGKGRYVLPTLNQMTAEMQTANKVRVGTGDLVMDGRVVTNEAAVDLTVESGTSGYKRNDLVVCRYTKNASTGVETFAAEVVKGTPTTGTAADPEVTEGDISAGSAAAVMPLWRIPLDGITPGAPVRIAPVASTLKTLGDSVSQCTRLWYKSYNTDVAPSAVTFTAPGGLDSYDYLVFFGKTSEWKRVSATLSRDNSFNSQYFQLTAPYAPTGGTDIYERMTGYKVAVNGESVTVSPQWYNEVHFSASGCDVSTGKGVPLYEVVGVRHLP